MCPPVQPSEWCRVEVEIGILEGILVALEEHARECERPPKAILLNRGNYELIRWHEVLGLPFYLTSALSRCGFVFCVALDAVATARREMSGGMRKAAPYVVVAEEEPV